MWKFRKIKHFYTIVLIIEIICKWNAVANGWLLIQLGLNESYNVHHLSTHFSRVFLSISVESKTFPTLIETQWPVSYLPMRTLVFPYIGIHANGNHDDCTRLHQSYWSQVDSLSRLWVMDAGWRAVNNTRVCPPKLLVFDLIRNNIEVLRIDCSKHIPNNSTEGLVIKLGPRSRSCEVERYIFFIIPNAPQIIAYDILEQTWQVRQLFSNKYETLAQTFPVNPIDFTFGLQGELILSDQDGILYSSFVKFNLNTENTIQSNEYDKSIELTSIGSLLGPSRGLMFDYLGALFYTVPKFGTVVRCAQISNLTAEGSEIIYMTSKNIQQIFFGVEGSVWILTDKQLKPHDICSPLI